MQSFANFRKKSQLSSYNLQNYVERPGKEEVGKEVGDLGDYLM